MSCHNGVYVSVICTCRGCGIRILAHVETIKCGVYAGRYQGVEVAVKVTDPYYSARRQYIKDLRVLQEIWAYQQMQQIAEIYGTLVPELLAFARLPRKVFILVISKQGQSLSDYVDEHKQGPDQSMVLASLSRLHSCGVIHGSPRFDNITFKPGCQDVCFIDLQRARVNKYRWKTSGEVYDRSIQEWREATLDEQLVHGSESLVRQIMDQVKVRAKEFEYVSRLLEADYSQLDSDCLSFQRGRFKVDY